MFDLRNGVFVANVVSTLDRPPDGDSAYTPPRSALYVSLACVLFFLGMAVASCWVTLAYPNGTLARPVGGLVMGGFWATFAVLAAVEVRGSRRRRVTVSATVVRVTSAFRERTVQLADVRRAVWRSWPAGGSLVINSSAGRLTIGFWSYKGGKDLARLLRAALPPGVQAGYERFEASALPESEAFRRLHGRGAWRTQVALTICLLGLGVLFLAAGVVREWDARLLLVAAINLAGGAVFARSIVRNRCAERDTEPVRTPDRDDGN